MIESLFQIYRDQSKTSVFAYFPFNAAKGEDWESPFERLAFIAKNEKWDYRHTLNAGRVPILRSYLNQTFLRLSELELIKYSANGQMATFNTGLQTPEEKDIYALFRINLGSLEQGYQPWTFVDFFDSYNAALDDLRPLPDLASYINDPKLLIFDTKLNIDINYEHIYFDNKERLPTAIRENKNLSINAIRGAIELAKERVRRNYKSAIPMWYRGRLQLLLPAYITSNEIADLAFVADRVNDVYMIRTILTMDMAYNNARLISRPDRDWLNP